MTLFEKDKERELIKLFQKDPDRGMEAIYRAYADFLMGICARYVPDQDERKDVLQDSFIKIFTQLAFFEYKGKGALKAWVTRIAINEALLFLRKEKRRATVSLEEENMPDMDDEEPQVQGLTPEELTTLIQELPEGYRTVFNLFAIEGKSHKEIAALLGIRADSSASQYHRAKTLLAKNIMEYKRKHEK